MSSLKINIDFQIYNTGDPKVMSVVDYSSWAHISNKPSIIEIITPGDIKPYIHYFDKNKVNIFNSANLGLTCTNGCEEDELITLPDGIYKVTVKGSPSKYNKYRYYLRTENTRLDLDLIYINSIKGDNVINISDINEIELLLDSAESNTKYENIARAQSLLFMAQDLIEKLKCNNCK